MINELSNWIMKTFISNEIKIVYGLCIYFLVCRTVKGSDINCQEDCACCKYGQCEKGQWFPDQCTMGCIDGYFGARCYDKCPKNCKTCTSKSGIEHCTDCYDGFYPGPVSDCTSECLPNCKTCTSGNSCTSCKEEYYSENGSNDCRYRHCPRNCKCENDQCGVCIDGYYNTSNSCNDFCARNCVSCSSSTNCESCTNGHYNGYQYDDNNLPFLNNCLYKCRDNCVQCSTYDFCSVCKTGLYGPTCENSCSAGCIVGICEIQTGNCDCSPNFDGDKCDRCQNGKYGDMCNQQCSTGCKDNFCNKESGNCIDGCDVKTIVGEKCDVCLIGWHGTYCNISCSVGCKNNQCMRTDGECIHGCLNNFIGKQCNQCISGKYGDKCNSECPNNCNGEGCSKESGRCIKCAPNFDGEKCDRCVIGLYGLTCSKICPPKCLNIACERNYGTCSYGCVDNYSGDKCCTNNNNCIKCLTDTKCIKCISGYFNDQCDEPCHQNCIESCNIKTGICDDCKTNFYGEHCKFSCASTCKNQSNTEDNKCHRMDGTCRHGCADGFYGSWCSKNCSSYCIDTICNQGDGKCLKGCHENVYNSPICPLDSDFGTSEQAQNIATVVLGIILAVLMVGYLILLAIVILRKLRQRKSTGRPIYENTDVELTCDAKRNIKEGPSTSQASNINDMARSRDYEDLGGARVTEHEYGQIRIPA